ncbi:MAG: LamG domain-containing protein [Phycisphaerales bacterium]|jgi:hypothetical protein
MYRKLICFMFALTVLTLTSSTYAIVIGDFEDDLDGWTGNGTLSIGTVGATSGSSSLDLTTSGGYWELTWNVPALKVLDLTNVTTLEMDVTMLVDNFADGTWTNVDKMSINSDLGWREVLRTEVIDRDTGEATASTDWGTWSGDSNRTIIWDIAGAGYDWTGLTESSFANINIAVQDGTAAGIFHIDNIRLNGAELKDRALYPILKLDVQNDSDPNNVEEGFTAFTLADSGSEIDGITVTIEEYGADDARRRDDPAGIPYENIYRDFIFARQAEAGVGYVTVTLSGLDPNGLYGITIYSFDTASDEIRITDWSANGSSLLTTVADNSIPPVEQDDYASTGLATADPNGVILMEAVPGEGTFAAEPFAFINALVVSSTVEPAPPGIVYVDATDASDPNVAANTILTTGEDLVAGDPGTVGSGSDNLWRQRTGFSNGGNIFEAAGDWSGPNPEDCPRLATSVEVPEGKYEVYAYMWTAGTAIWSLNASLEDSEGELPLYVCGDPNGAATLAMEEDFEEPVPLVTEADRTMWQIPLGTTDTTTVITVYIDDDANRGAAGDGGNARTWYDGIGYKLAPAPEGPSTEGLVAYYSLEGDVLDASDNMLDGIIMGDPAFVEGVVGMAIDLDGIDDYVDCGTNEELNNLSQKMTVATWVNIRSITTAWMAIAGKGETAWRLGVNNDTTSIHFGFTGGTRGWQAANSVTEIPLEEWHHVAGVYDNEVGATIYVDGVPETVNPDLDGTATNEMPFFLGENPEAAGRFLDGMLDEVMIYGRALSEEEILSLAGK